MGAMHFSVIMQIRFEQRSSRILGVVFTRWELAEWSPVESLTKNNEMTRYTGQRTANRRVHALRYGLIYWGVTM